MGNLTKYPLEDNYTTTLTQALSASGTTIYVAGTPNFTFPSGVTTYLVVNPGKTNQETIEVSAYDSSAKTFTVANRNKSKGASVTSTAQVHSVGSTVIISDNFQFWEDILTAINSKINDDGSGAGTSFDLQVSGSNFRIRKDGNDMKLRDDNNNEITLSQLSALSGADTKVAISANDTTPSQLESKLIAGDGISITKGNAGGNETLTSAIDLDADSGLEFNSGKLKAKSASTTQKGIVQMATDAEVTAGTNEEKYVNPKQLNDSTLISNVVSQTFTIGDNSQSDIVIAHGLGKIPKIIIGTKMHDNTSSGENFVIGSASYDGSSIIQKSYDYKNNLYVNSFAKFNNSSNEQRSWEITSIDSTNVTFSFTSGSGVSGTRYLYSIINFIG